MPAVRSLEPVEGEVAVAFPGWGTVGLAVPVVGDKGGGGGSVRDIGARDIERRRGGSGGRVCWRGG